MTKAHSTRRALGLSILALVLCFSMLLGTTFAWFTDTAKTGVNKIQAGTLKIDLYHEVDATTANELGLVADEDQNMAGWYSIKENPNHAIWNYDRWEPGYTNYESVKIVNEGNLALKYVLQVTMEGTTVDEETGADLAEVIEVYVIPDAVDPTDFATVKSSWQYVGTLKDLFTDPDGVARGVLLPKGGTATAGEAVETVTMTVALHMKEEAGNEYQGLTLGDLYVNLFATQYTYENDSFNNQYDKDAYLPIVKTAGELKSALENGESVQLANDIVGDGEAIVVPEGASAVLNLNGFTYSNSIGKSAGHVIDNKGELTIVGGAISSTADNGGSAIRNSGTLTVSNATINGAPKAGTSWPSYAINNGGDMTVNDTVIVSNHGSIAGYGGGTTTLNNVSVTMNGMGGSSHVIYTYDAGTKVIINGGSYTHGGNVDGSIAYIKTGSTVIVNDGTFSASNGGYGMATTKGELIVNGGMHNNSFLNWGGPITVTGGTFANNPSAYVASGYKAVKVDTLYYVVPETAEADNLIFTADDMLALSDKYLVSNNGVSEVATYVLMSDIDLGGAEFKNIGVAYGDTFNFVGNGHTISNVKLGSGTDNGMTNVGMFYVDAGATLNVTNLKLDNVVVSDGVDEYTTGAAAVVGYSNGAVNLTNVDVSNANVNNTFGNAAIYVGYTISNVNLTDCDVVNSIVSGEVKDGAVRADKTGVFVGTANTKSCEVTTTNCTNATSYSDYGRVIYGAVWNGVTYVSDASNLTEVVAAGATNIFLNNGEYNVANCGGKDLTISGTEKAVLKLYNEGEAGCDYGFGDSGATGGKVTINGVTIDTTANTGNYKGYCYMAETVYNDCTFFGGFSTVNNPATFNRCKFNFNNDYLWIWGATAVTFNDCEFGGNTKAILAHGSASTVITINNCDFIATEVGKTGAGDITAAVEIDPVGSNTYTINFTGENTITSSYAGWTRVKDGSTGHVITGMN